MRFDSIAEARYYVNSHSPKFRKKLHIVKFNRFDYDKWKYAETFYTVVIK